MFIATTVEAAPALKNEGGGVGVHPTLLPAGSSRVSGSADSVEVDDNPLKSTVLRNEVMDVLGFVMSAVMWTGAHC